MRKKLYYFILFVLVFLILDRVPIKKSISKEEVKEKMSEKDVYLCEYVATTGPSWQICESSDSVRRLVCLEGKVPINYINKEIFFHFSRNKFMIKGEIIGKRVVDNEGRFQDYYGNELQERGQLEMNVYECYDIIYVNEWDIISPIERENSFRFWESKDYLNVFDFIG